MQLPAIIHLIVAARPNFMKVAPLYHALARAEWCRPVLVHTGQHYDERMSEAFLRDLKLPEPHIALGVGSGSHAEQTAGVMIAYEKVCLENPPHWTVVVGDVNSTMACTLSSKKLNLPVAHLEAGLRSGDRSMPEEINRVVTDAICDLHWTPSEDADRNLLREGVAPSSVVRVGNIMMDAFEMLKDRIHAASTVEELGLSGTPYGVVTLHRPSNVDTPEELSAILDVLTDLTKKCKLVFPIHPRTRKRLTEFGLWERISRVSDIVIAEPMGYVRFMNLVCQAKLVVTDSGGLQEETTYLQIPCFTLRENTERPITITRGSNRLVLPSELAECVNAVFSGDFARSQIPDLWDGHTAERVVESLRKRVLGT